MIIGILEYGEVRVFEHEGAVMQAWRNYPQDLAAQVIVLYDNDGSWLEPVFTPGPRRWFGLLRGTPSVSLRRARALEPGVDPIGLALLEATTLVPNKYYSSLEELRERYPFTEPAARNT